MARSGNGKAPSGAPSGDQRSSSGQVGTSGGLHPFPYNEVNNFDPNTPDTDLIYENYEHRDKWHLAQIDASLLDTPNSRSGHGINGGPTAGEPNPFDMSLNGTVRARDLKASGRKD